MKYADRLFDDKFKVQWNKKFQEYTTANRLYCPSKGCGQWIKPSKIKMDPTYGRKYARCSSCNTKVCVLCNSKFHTKRECPKDEETNRLVEMAKEKECRSTAVPYATDRTKSLDIHLPNVPPFAAGANQYISLSSWPDIGHQGKAIGRLEEP